MGNSLCLLSLDVIASVASYGTCNDLVRLLVVSSSARDTIFHVFSEYLTHLYVVLTPEFVSTTQAGLTELVTAEAGLGFGRQLLLVKKSDVDDAVSGLLCYCSTPLKLLSLSSKAARKLQSPCLLVDKGWTSCCPNLSDLHVPGYLRLTDVGLKQIMLACPHIKTLDVRRCNQLTDGMTKFFCDNDEAALKLESVRLASCPKITAKGTTRFMRCCLNLQAVDIRRVGSGGTTMLALSQLKKLKRLDIRQCGTSKTGLSCTHMKMLAQGCTLLEELRLEWMEADPNQTIPYFAANCKKLKVFEMCWDGLQAPAISCLVQSCRELTELILNGCSWLQDQAFHDIAQYCGSTLQVLEADECRQGITCHSLQRIVQGCTRLRRLSVEGCTKIDGGSVDGIWNCKELVTFRMEIMPGKVLPSVDTKTLLDMVTTCTHLQEITFERCGLHDNILAAFGEHLPYLHTVLLPFNDDITEVGITNLVSGGCGRRISKLVVNGCTKIQQSGFLSIAQQCKSLHALHAAFCEHLDLQIMTLLVDSCPAFGIVDITDNGISIAAADEWQAKYPHMRVFKIDEWEEEAD